MDKIRVLVADDHAIMRDGIRALLSLSKDIEIVGEAGDGNEAIDKARELAPDVIIMDISMPGIDGLEASRRIKKQSPKTRILILTQHDDKQYVLSAVKAGASGYLPKRALGSELISAIRSIYRGESFLHPSVATAVIEDYRQQATEKDPYDTLTSREREVLKLLAEGQSTREIAAKLFISQKTVIGHRAKIMEKLDLHNRSELFKFAARKGLVSLDS